MVTLGHGSQRLVHLTRHDGHVCDAIFGERCLHYGLLTVTACLSRRSRLALRLLLLFTGLHRLLLDHVLALLVALVLMCVRVGLAVLLATSGHTCKRERIDTLLGALLRLFLLHLDSSLFLKLPDLVIQQLVLVDHVVQL